MGIGALRPARCGALVFAFLRLKSAPRFARFLMFAIVTIAVIVWFDDANAFTLTPDIEAFVLPGVGFAFTSVTFENTYSNPVPVCTYNLPSSASQPATVRINALSSTGMQVKIQRFNNSSSVTPGAVHCIVVDAGIHTLPDGRLVQAGTVLSNATHGSPGDDGWILSLAEDVSASVSNAFSNPVALGQVITYNDVNASVPWMSDCDNRGNRPFQSGLADGFCISKHIGQINGSRANETMGWILIESGSGTFGDIQYEAAYGSDSVAGVGNSPPYSYSLGRTYEVAATTQAGEDGGQGGWSVLYGANPLAGGQIDVAIDEENIAGDTSRTHTLEQVAYWAITRLPEFTLDKTVDLASVSEPQTLTYSIVLENTGQLDLTGVSLTDILPDGSPGTPSGPVESFAGGSAGVLEPGETWTYTVTYDVSAAEVLAGTARTNTATATTTEYAAESLSAESDTATTTITPPAPSLSITKVADDTTDVPAGQTVTYTYTVTNTGNVTVDGVAISDTDNSTGPDPVPGGETLLTDNAPTGDSTDASADGTWDVLAPGDSITFTATIVVTQDDVEALQ